MRSLGWMLMLVLLWPSSVWSQSSSEEEIELEGLIEENKEDESAEEVLDIWEELRQNPVQLNRADYHQLIRIPGMRPHYVKVVLKYREKQGAFIDLDELYSVPGLPRLVAERIRPFLTLGSVKERLADVWTNSDYWLSGMKVELVSRVRGVVETAQGFRPDSVGNRAYGPQRQDTYQRLQVRTKRLSAGMTWRSGMGTTGTWMQPDLGSLHLGLTEVAGIRSFALGSYRLRYGMGLAMNTGYAPRKGLQMVNPQLSSKTVAPFTGSSYLGHFRGLAATVGERVQLSLWASRRGYTASSANADSLKWSTTEPYFRTANERARRDNLIMSLGGARVLLPWKSGWLAASAWKAKTDKPLGKGIGFGRSSDPTGSEFSMFSLDGRLDVGNVSLAGEGAIGHHKKMAAIVAFESRPVEGLEHIVIFRRYEAGFQSLFGNAFSAWSGAPSNETGLYSAWNFRRLRSVELLMFVDFYRSFEPRPGTTLPQSGSELGSRSQFQWLSHTLAIQMRRRSWDEWKTIEDDFGREFQSRLRQQRLQWRAELNSNIGQEWKFKTRAEWVQFSPHHLPTETGTMVFQEVGWKAGRRLRLQARVCLFRTDGYDTRLVAYESDVALISGNFAMQGEGSRQFLLVTFRPWSWGELQFKWAQTKMYGVYELGSGNDRIQSDTKTFINASLRATL